MRKEKEIRVTIETQAIGDVITLVPYDGANENIEFTLKIPSREVLGAEYNTILDLTKVVANDIEVFKKLNERNDEEHQVYLETLCIYGLQIRGPYIRIQYWFHQDGNEKIRRMCDGVLTYYVKCDIRKDFVNVVYPEFYSQDCRVYW